MASDNVFPLNPKHTPRRDKPRGPPDTTGNGNPPGGGDMEKRVEALEKEMGNRFSVLTQGFLKDLTIG